MKASIQRTGEQDRKYVTRLTEFAQNVDER